MFITPRQSSCTWIDTKKMDILYQELGNRIEALDDGFLINDTIEKKLKILLLRGISEPRFMVLSQIDHFMGKW